MPVIRDAKRSIPLKALRSRFLRKLDRFFPPDPQARKTSIEATAYEVHKAPGSMGTYLAELGREDIDVLDFGAGWGGETLWLAKRVRSVGGVDVDVRSVARARAAQQELGIANCRFECSTDGRIP